MVDPSRALYRSRGLDYFPRAHIGGGTDSRMRKTVITLTAALALLVPASASADAGWMLTPSTVDFGRQVVGTTGQATVELTNDMGAPFEVLIIGAAVFAILVIRALTARQDRKNELIATGQLV